MRKPEPKEYVIQPKGWRKRYKCHKNKGDHTFVLEYATMPTWYMAGKIFEYHVCTACGKKKFDVV